jgi:hypothetical protein
MATQYNGGLVAGQILTAATMNSIGATWETWTPTYSASSGTLTTVTTNLARYMRIQKTVTAQIVFTITNIGTASGRPFFTLPITATTVPQLPMGPYRESANTGFIGVVSWENTTTAVLQRYDNAVHLVANNVYTATFTYEAA